MNRFLKTYIAIGYIILFVFLAILPITIFAQTIGSGVPVIYKVSDLIGTVHAASGCNAHTGLKTGGAACDNDVAVINKITRTAVLGAPIKLIVDRGIGINACIALALTNADIELEGMGKNSTAGIFVLSGSNTTAISNVPGNSSDTACLQWLDGLTTVTHSGHVTINNLYINANRGTYPTGNCTIVDARCGNNSGPWATGIQLKGLETVDFINSEIYDAPTFGLLVSDTDRVNATGCDIISPTLGTNTDPIHIDGTVGSVNIADCYLKAGDDGLAFNGNEGIAGIIGPITFSNIRYESTISYARLYMGTSTYTIGPVTCTNLSGTIAASNGYTPAVFRMGNTGPGAVDALNLTCSNVEVQGPGPFVAATENIGQLNLSNIRWMPTSTNPFMQVSSSALVSNFTCTSCSIYRKVGANSAAFWGQISSGSTIKRHECNGCSIINEQGQSTSAISYGWDIQSGGSIGSFLNRYDMTNMTSLVNSDTQWTRVTKLMGQPLTATTGSIGGSVLIAGACATGTVTVSGATTGMVAHANASSADPTNGGVLGVAIDARVTSANTVTVSVCSPIAGTPTASTYAVMVQPSN